MRTAVRAKVRQANIFYGWWMVVAGIAMTMVHGGLWVYGFSAYFRPLVDEFGWTRTALSSVISLSRLEGGLIGPVAGFMIDRFGPRAMMLVGIAIMSTGFVLLSRAQDFLSFAVVYIFVLSLASSFGPIRPIQTALANWFIRKRSFVLGLLFAGFGFGGALVPLTAWIIERFGWRTATLVSAAALVTVGIPIALMMRHRPEQYGYLPDGDPPYEAAPAGAVAGALHQGARSRQEVDFTPFEAMKTRAFWLISFAWLLWSMLPAIITVHALPYLIDVGFSPQVAANILGVYAFASGLSRVFIGWLGDRVTKRYLVSGLWMMQVVALFALANVHTLLDVVPFILLYAPAYGGLVPLRGALQGEYFGRAYFATISGIIGAVDLVATVAGPIVVGWAFDNAGGVEGYRLAFRAIAVINIVGALAMLAAVPPILKRVHQEAPGV